MRKHVDECDRQRGGNLKCLCPPGYGVNRPELDPTYANIVGRDSRNVVSHCCKAGVGIKLRTSDTTAGNQLVWYCWQCWKLYVAREKE